MVAALVPKKLPRRILDRIESVRNKRARAVLDEIAKNGTITTEKLKNLGYNHPPRAARDVRELGFCLITTRVKGSDGRSIGAYSLDVTSTLARARKTGRLALPKKERDSIIERANKKCQLCAGTYDLQVDHRVPYEVAGETLSHEENAFMVLDGSCNRKKSWACEHCDNFLQKKDTSVCGSCYWAFPEEHTHVAMQPVRRLEILWVGAETKDFDVFKQQHAPDKRPLPEIAKEALRSKE